MLVLTLPGPFKAASGAFAPTDIAGLLGWYRGSSLSALADGDPVGQWNDEGGANNHLLQATALKKPLYRATGGPGGKPAVDFDATDDILFASCTIAWPTTVFLVLNQTTWTGGKIIFAGSTASGTMDLRQNATTPNVRQQASANGAAVTGPALGAWGLVTAVYNGASSTMALNGGSNVASNPGTGTPIGIRLGTADVTIAELLVYNSALSSTDQASVKAYLNTKYGLY